MCVTATLKQHVVLILLHLQPLLHDPVFDDGITRRQMSIGSLREPLIKFLPLDLCLGQLIHGLLDGHFSGALQQTENHLPRALILNDLRMAGEVFDFETRSIFCILCQLRFQVSNPAKTRNDR